MKEGRYGFGYPTDTQSITTTGASQASAAFSDVSIAIRIACTQATRVAFGTAPVATASSLLLTAGDVEYFVVRPGSKIAVLQDSVAGSLTVSEMTA